VEQIAPGTGFLCATMRGFEEAVDRLRSAGERRRMSRAALAHADRTFSLDRFGRDVVQVLRNAVMVPVLRQARDQ
jgi:hypothetical protein